MVSRHQGRRWTVYRLHPGLCTLVHNNHITIKYVTWDCWHTHVDVVSYGSIIYSKPVQCTNMITCPHLSCCLLFFSLNEQRMLPLIQQWQLIGTHSFSYPDNSQTILSTTVCRTCILSKLKFKNIFLAAIFDKYKTQKLLIFTVRNSPNWLFCCLQNSHVCASSFCVLLTHKKKRNRKYNHCHFHKYCFKVISQNTRQNK